MVWFISLLRLLWPFPLILVLMVQLVLPVLPVLLVLPGLLAALQPLLETSALGQLLSSSVHTCSSRCGMAAAPGLSLLGWVLLNLPWFPPSTCGPRAQAPGPPGQGRPYVNRGLDGYEHWGPLFAGGWGINMFTETAKTKTQKEKKNCKTEIPSECLSPGILGYFIDSPKKKKKH